ncbi:hypothetical protein FRB90_000312 [Tulasnella sp. 427]|nr:hypothetical protein FRB90_000312 [Tulasnella sp. 427]
MSSFTLDVEPSVQALIKEVWHQSWEDFQSWKHQDLAPSEIAAASVGKTAGALVKQEQETQLYFLGPARSSLNDRPAQLKSSSRKSQTLKTWNFPLSADPDSNLVSQASHTIPVYPCDPADDILEPVPPYEACDPTNLTFQVIDTAAERETLEFMPFGNEPEFLAKNPFFLVDRKTGENIFKMQWEFSDRDPDGT